MMKAGKKSIISFLIEAILYVYASILFFKGFQVFCTDLQDFSHALAVVPVFLSYLSVSLWLYVYRSLIFKQDDKKRNRTIKIGGIAFIVAGSILETLAIINMTLGKYPFVWLGNIFPIDMLLINAITVGIGVFGLKKRDWVLEHAPALTKDHLVMKGFRPLIGLFVLFQEYFFGGFLSSSTFLDMTAKWFALSIPLLFLCFFGSFLLAYREFVLYERNIRQSEAKLRIGFEYTLFGIALVCCLAVMIINFTPASQYISYNLQGFFVLDYIASLNLAPYLIAIPTFGFVSLIVLHSIFMRKRFHKV